MVYWEPILLSTLKVSKFRASALLIGDLFEVSTRPLHGVCVHARMCARMCPAVYHNLLSAVQAAFTACRCGRVGALFQGGMWSKDVTIPTAPYGSWENGDDTLCLVCSGPSVVKVQTNDWQSSEHYSSFKAWQTWQTIYIYSWLLQTATAGWIDKKQRTFIVDICVTPSD